MPTILVTGGAGYIGSHCCVELLAAGHDVVVVDNLDNSHEQALERVQRIAGRPLTFHRVDLVDRPAVEGVFAAHHFDAVIHFAGLKAVGESTEKPLRYYHNNITGTLILLEAMRAHAVTRLVFSSSATVYGTTETMPLREDAPLGATNPYGRTKLFIEEMLRDLAAAEKDWRIILLRYFNPVGAHASGTIGEDPIGIPNNLMPFALQVAMGQRDYLRVFGGDYPTPDGTGVRDYIHVVDLVLGHLAALDWLDKHTGCRAFNLGTGKGNSVLEVVRALTAAAGKEFPYEIVGRRPGDVAVSYADPTAAARELGWRATRNLDDMCRDSWRWATGNPQGYRGA